MSIKQGEEVAKTVFSPYIAGQEEMTKALTFFRLLEEGFLSLKARNKRQ